ncbi:MAG: TonB-dependent receptor domain-containing protein, partial [Draconibacterium sp.]
MKIKLIASIVCFLAICSMSIKAQEATLINVSGIVTDTLIKPVEYATIQLFSTTDSTKSYGAISTMEGTYTIKNVALDSYLLKVSSIGYQTFEKNVEIKTRKKTFSLGLIRLKQSNYKLEGVEVTASRTGINERADKIVFVPDSMSLRTAKTGIDVLNKIPEIKVDKRNQAVSVLGNKNVLVLINGADNDRSIVSIHPDDIEKVEVITHPSVKYRSDVASVVNIVLKGHKEQGFSFNSNLYYGLNHQNHVGNFQLDYNIGKWHFFASFAGNKKETISIDSTHRADIYEGNEDEYLSYPITDNIADAGFYKFQYGFDYEINKNNLLSFTSRINQFDIESFRNMGTTSLSNDVKTKYSQLSSVFESEKTDQNYSLYYLHKFKNENEKLEINMNYFNLHKNSEHFVNDSSVYYPSRDITNTDRVILKKSKQNSLNARLDYSLPLSKAFTFESGYQFYHRKVSDKADATGAENNNISYTDFRHSLYVNGSYKLGKINVQAGARVENFNTEFDEVQNNQTKFLPYGAVFYQPHANHSLKLTYRKSLTYPVYSYLNPFRYYSSDSLSYFSGNPYLKPEKNNSFNLKYSFKKKSHYASLNLFYNHLNDLISQKATLQKQVVAYRYDNVGKARQYGGVLSLSSILFDWVEVEMLLKGNYTDFLNNDSHSGYSYSAECGIYTPLVW